MIVCYVIIAQLGPKDVNEMPNDNVNVKSTPRLKAATMQLDNTLMIGIGEKGGISIYGLQRFPVTMYREQWERLVNVADEIKQFAIDHADLLSDGKPQPKTLANTSNDNGMKVNVQDIAVLKAEADRLTAAGDVPGAIKYATLKGVAEATGKLPPEGMLELLTLKVRK
jgi:hypothetical protein